MEISPNRQNINSPELTGTALAGGDHRNSASEPCKTRKQGAADLERKAESGQQTRARRASENAGLIGGRNTQA